MPARVVRSIDTETTQERVLRHTPVMVVDDVRELALESLRALRTRTAALMLPVSKWPATVGRLLTQLPKFCADALLHWLGRHQESRLGASRNMSLFPSVSDVTVSDTPIQRTTNFGQSSPRQMIATEVSALLPGTTKGR